MKKKILKIILIVLILAVIAVSAYFILRACGFTTKEKFIQLRSQLGDSIWFWLIVGLLQIIQAIFIPVSNQIITVPLSLIFPVNELWKVWITSWISIWIATLILYFIGRFGGKKILKWILSDEEQTEKCTNFLKRGWMFYPLGMLLPLPDDIVTVLAGTAKMNFLFIFVCSLITRAIDTSISVFGFGILAKNWWGWIVMIGGFIILTIVSIIIYKKKGTQKQ